MYFVGGTVAAQTCYSCNYIDAASSDPALANELGTLASRQMSSLACQRFTGAQTGTLSTVDCKTLNLASPPAPFNALSFPATQWMCGQQDFSFVMRDYGMRVPILMI